MEISEKSGFDDTVYPWAEICAGVSPLLKNVDRNRANRKRNKDLTVKKQCDPGEK